ncbi:MAG: diguanylate cyclase domain-containing protein [Gammaproteobacteria bacterium]
MDPRAVILGSVLLAAPFTPARALTPQQTFHEYARHTWSLGSGLPQVSVDSIVQGPQGYMWFGTQDGVARFDGVRFQNLLPSVWAQALFVDRSGTLWIGIYKGLEYYRDGRFDVPQPAPGFPKLDPGKLDVLAFLQLADGRVLAGSPQGLYVIDGTEIAPYAPLPQAPTYSLAHWSGALWIGSAGGVYRIAGAQVRHLALPSNDTKVWRISTYDGTLWLGTSRGLYRYVSGGWRRIAGDPAALRTQVVAMLVDSDGNFWVASDAGLARIRNGRLAEFISNHDPAAVPNIQSFYQDREHNLWVGSDTNGVTQLWNGYVRRFSVPAGLTDPVVWAVAPAAQGGAWIGTTGGLYLLQQGRARRVVAGKALPDPSVIALLDDGERLWIGTDAGVRTYQHGHLYKPASLGALLNAPYVHSILRDRSGNYWFATSKGLYRLARDALSYFGTAQGLSDTNCRVLFETRDGWLLVGTADGLYRITENRLVRVGVNRGLPTHIWVTAISELPGGELMLGTFTDGRLYLFAGSRWHTLTEAQGLPMAQIAYLAPGANGWLWVGSGHGIYRFKLDELHALLAGRTAKLHPQMLVSENGLWPGSQQGYCCNSSGDNDGFMQGEKLWLATQDGVAVADTAHVITNTVVPPVLVQAIQYANRWHALNASDDVPLLLPAADRDLAFRFTVLSLQNPLSVALQYRLVGYESGWKTLDDVSKRVANYTNLPPGNYSLEVRGANNGGVWNPDPAVLQFRIGAYFYETLWFRILVTLLILTTIYLGYRFQLRHLHRQRAHLKSVVAQHTDELRVANQRLAGANLQLEEASQTDWLTGLKNRRYLYEQLPRELGAFREHLQTRTAGNQVMVFALADLDNFKNVNDTLGHAQGDEVLRQIARHLEEVVCSGELVVRWGGEEFLLVFRPMPRSAVEATVMRVQRAVSECAFLGLQDEPLQLTCSVGFVEYPFAAGTTGGADWETLVNIADLALYRAKSGGRNAWIGLRPGPRFNAKTLAVDFRRGLAELLKSQILALVQP